MAMAEAAGDAARARDLAAGAADPRVPATHRSELRILASIHATLALTEAIDKATAAITRATAAQHGR